MMIKAVVFACFVVFVCAQHTGGGNHHPPHHPHPDNKQCTNDADCSGCVTNTTGYCNLQDNLCYCRPVTAKRAACHNGHQCACPDGQNGVCNAQGHCECGDHPVGKRADCHNGHQCSCPDGQNGVCNSHGHCDCGDHTVGKRAAHVGSHCGQKSDCAGLDCAGKDYDCVNMKCACHEDSHAGGR